MKTYLLVTAGIAGLVFLAACTASRAGYESAPYSVSRTEGKCEVRDYPELVVASTGDASSSGRDGGFMRLFRYISGQNERSEKIAMTTPVFMGANGEEGKMSFVVPSDVAKKGAPTPKAADVKVETIPAGRWAVLRFSGNASPKSEASALADLRSWMSRNQLSSSGKPVFAYFDPPWTPGPMRRNEVMLPLPMEPAKP